jgi:hypothetical protein
MGLTFEVINGLGFGLEHISKDLEDEIDESVIVVTFLCFRWIIWLNDLEE